MQRGQYLWILLHANRGWDLSLGLAGSMRVAGELRGFPRRWHAKELYPEPMIAENRRLVANEPVEFEK